VIVVHGHAINQFGLMDVTNSTEVILILQHDLEIIEGDAVLFNEFTVLDVLMNFISRGVGRTSAGNVVFMNRTTLLFVAFTAMFTSTNPFRGWPDFVDHHVVVFYPE
tara:strand:+ start:277 stop:597 length:321 start_codon:yes stop_codon:yes gene_type:complete